MYFIINYNVFNKYIINVTTTEINTCKKIFEFGQRGVISFFTLVTNNICKVSHWIWDIGDKPEHDPLNNNNYIYIFRNIKTLIYVLFLFCVCLIYQSWMFVLLMMPHVGPMIRQYNIFYFSSNKGEHFIIYWK